MLDLLNDYAFIHVVIAASLGALIGLEREIAGKDPSLRTFSLISLGSCTFTLLSVMISNDSAPGASDPSRVAAQIVAGIGFLGAGTIFRSPRGVSGFTTAALMWVTAAIGMAVGFNHVSLAVSTTFTALFVTFALRYVHKLIRIFRKESPNDGVE